MTMHRRVELAYVRGEFLDLLTRVVHTRERVVVALHGTDLAVVIPMEDWQLLESLSPSTSAADQIGVLEPERKAPVQEEDKLLRFTKAGLRAAARRRKAG